MLNMTIFHPFHQNTVINGGWFQMFKKVTFQSIIYTVEKVPLTFFVNTRDKLNFKKPKLFNLTKRLNVIIIGFATVQASTASSFKV